MALRTLLIVYVLGGLTFIPLVLLAIFAFAYYTLPRVSTDTKTAVKDNADRIPSDSDSDISKDDGFVDKDDAPSGSANDASGYFAVCREYVPGGVNGKPPERSSPAGEVLNSESPSVYQSMYRSIFERGKTQQASLEGDKKDQKAVKRPRNVFFVVARHAHILLFDNSEQLEVRHVISLLHHDVDIYAEDEELEEGDLWIKKNCIRLTRRSLPGHASATSQPFYIFSDNCSEKEDFYHALLAAQSTVRDTESTLSPKPRKFETDHMIKLVQALHTNDSDHHARWFNALLGRMFLAIYKTEDIRDAIKAKIDRKISRVPKPNFISSIQVQSVDMGDAAPIFSNWKLRELSMDGALTVETDVKYTGGLRLQIAAIARIELGSRIRAREVDLVLAGLLRKLSGHMLIKIKPPPSNRLWISFETIPHMDLSVEPVVSSMQITYGVILRAIESRIREVVGETLVHPNWDDIPFFDTDAYECRGGIWDTERKAEAVTRDTVSEVIHTDPIANKSPTLDASATSPDDVDRLPVLSPKTASMPNLLPSPTKDVTFRKPSRKSIISETDNQGIVSASTSISTRDATPLATPEHSKPSSPRIAPADRDRDREREKPKTLRSNSFASPTIALSDTTEDINPTVSRSTTPKSKWARDAADYVKQVKDRSDSMSFKLSSAATAAYSDARDSISSAGEDNEERQRSNSDVVPTTASSEIVEVAKSPVPSATFPLSELAPSPQDKTHASRKSWNLSASPPPGGVLEKGMNAARLWGINMINRQNVKGAGTSGFTSLAKEAGIEGEDDEQHPQMEEGKHHSGTKSAEKDTREQPASSQERAPIGRGQPLPPPGSPLPGPKQSLWSASNFNIGGTFKRKTTSTAPGGETSSTGSPVDESREQGSAAEFAPKEQQEAVLWSTRKSSVSTGHQRRRSSARFLDEPDDANCEVVVVAAPVSDDDESSIRQDRIGARSRKPTTTDQGAVESGAAAAGEVPDATKPAGASPVPSSSIPGQRSSNQVEDPQGAAAAAASEPDREPRVPSRSPRQEMPPPLPVRSHTPSPTKTPVPALPVVTGSGSAAESIDRAKEDSSPSTSAQQGGLDPRLGAEGMVKPFEQAEGVTGGGTKKGKGGWYMSAFPGGGNVRPAAVPAAVPPAGRGAGRGKGKQKGD